MSVFIADIDAAKLYVQFLRPSVQCVVLFKCWFLWIRLWVVTYKSLMLPRYSGKYWGDIKKPMAGDWAYMISRDP